MLKPSILKLIKMAEYDIKSLNVPISLLVNKFGARIPVVKKPIRVPTYKSTEDWKACFLIIPKFLRANFVFLIKM